jgi:eukaryotic-like serine/threonine-protein kinase
VVYVGSGTAKVYALNAGTGALLWSYATGSIVLSSPAVANGAVYACADGIYALNASTGALLRTYAADYASPAVTNGVVYAGSNYSVDAFALL